MDVIGLQYFISAADHLNFTKAAEENHVTQPVISRKIRELEEEFGCEFFIRDYRGVQLTRDGEYFLQHANAFIENYENIKLDMAKYVGSHRGKISIAAPLPATVSYLPKIINSLKQKHPDIEVILDRMTPSMISRAISKGEYDFYICFSVDLKIFPQYNSSGVIERDYLHLYTNAEDCPCNMDEAKYILKHNTIFILSMEDSPYVNKLTKNLLSELSIPKISIKEIKPLESILYNVSSGLGVAVMPHIDYMLEEFNLRMFQLSDKYIIDMIQIWKDLSPEAEIYLKEFNCFQIGNDLRYDQ